VECVIVRTDWRIMLGAFESTLRSASAEEREGRRRLLHKGCSGHAHGHGVSKERPSLTHPKAGRSCSHEGAFSYESSDETLSVATCPTPDLLIRVRASAGRSQSSDAGMSHSPIPAKARSSSAASVAQRLYNSPTASNSAKKAKAVRAASDGRAMSAEIAKMEFISGKRGNKTRHGQYHGHEGDSGHFSSAEDDQHAAIGRHRPRIQFASTHDQAPPEQRRRTLITGASDDELLSMDELRRRQRRERREQQLQRRHSPRDFMPRVGPVRVSSPSPTKHRRPQLVPGGRGRRSSEEEDPSLSEDGASSTSPPATPSPMPPRSSSSRPIQPHRFHTVSRTSSTGHPRSSYAFGSSVDRFHHNWLDRTFSDASSVDEPPSPRSGHRRHVGAVKGRVEEAWLLFKEDVDAALAKKPGGAGAHYKDLSDMMHTKMESLGLEVGLKLGGSYEKQAISSPTQPHLPFESLRNGIVLKWWLRCGHSKWG